MREPGRPPPPYSKLDKPVRFPSTQLEDSSAPPDPPIPRIIYTTTEPSRGRRGRLASARFRLACSASARFWRDRRRVSGLAGPAVLGRPARYDGTGATAHTIDEFACKTARPKIQCGACLGGRPLIPGPRNRLRPRSWTWARLPKSRHRGHGLQQLSSLLRGDRILRALGPYANTATQATWLNFHHHGLVSNHPAGFLPLPMAVQHAAHPCGSGPAFCTL
jgi:hypothetical protein